MIGHEQTKALIASLICHGERIDPDDLSVLYGWIHSALVALEPYDEERKRFHESCWGSLGPPEGMLEAGLSVLRSVCERAEALPAIEEEGVSERYLNLLQRVCPQVKAPENVSGR